uniref:F-box domain-containing protein n=1 Tax=Meloidogyne enterolobii TaxID=390850 RepID=A0A6V7V8K9_MELEN|nr:unnamed protein product [Meloidogyne enterolobii]
MNSLPIETKLDIFKCLNFTQLFTFKQTNYYYRNLINKYGVELARMKFNKLSLIDANIINRELNRKIYPSNWYKIIEPGSEILEFILNDQLNKKWQAAISKSISLFLHDFEPDKEFIVCLERTFFHVYDKKPRYYLLKLPSIPKNIEEMIIVRNCLEQLFNCAFEYAYFNKIVFNPEIINLLFDNNQTISPQFHIQKPSLSTSNNLFENIFRFVLNHLKIFEFVSIDFNHMDIPEENINILFNILINEGNKLPKVYLKRFKLAKLHDLIVDHIINSQNCSKIVPVIIFDKILFSDFKLNERAEKIEIGQLKTFKTTDYQISNINNPKVRFLFSNEERRDGSIFYVQIKKM